MRLRSAIILNRIPSNYLSLRFAFYLFLGDIIIGILGFILIEHYSFVEAFYMTIITVSTVGYTEVRPLTNAGRLFTAIYISLNISIFAYLLAVISYYIIQGEIFKKMHENLVKLRIDKLKEHIIICGYGKYGREIAHQFSAHNISFVVIDFNEEKIEEIQKSEDNILYIQDDATHDEALINAGIERAKAVISALPDDSDNVFIVLTARQLNPKIKIISRAREHKSEKKLLLAGANHVVMPEQIGGFYMATLISKPGAVEFFSFITNEYQSDIGFEEIRYENLPQFFKGKTIKELHIRQHSGANIIGYKGPTGKYIVNPEPSIMLMPGSSFIILGDQHQLFALKNYLDSFSQEE